MGLFERGYFVQTMVWDSAGLARHLGDCQTFDENGGTTVNLFSFLLVLLALSGLVCGQIWLKWAMNYTHLTPIPWKKFIPTFAVGIGAMTLWFLLWLGLLQTLELSYLYPFEGLSAIFLSLAASFFLKEKMTLRLWVGIVLITLGVVFVSCS